MTELTKAQLQQQYEGTRLAVAAYGAADIKALLASNPNVQALSAGLNAALVKQGFSAEQADSFIAKYTPVAALDQDGAGAVLFRVNGTNQIATAVRGTSPDNRFPDLIADGTIAQNQLPTYQTTLIANFVLRETTPTGQSVPQFSVKGISSNADDLARATADTIGLLGRDNGGNTGLVTMPVVLQTGTVQGTGRAVGPCVDAAAHSEGSPEITTLGVAIAQCSRITTVNGPGVSAAQLQRRADQMTLKSGLPQIDLTKQNQLNIHTTGVSVIDDLNRGLPGDDSTVVIPTNYAGAVGDHSSIVAMNASEAAYFRGDVSQRIAPVGTVAMDPSHTGDYNFPDTAGAGRGTVNPDTVTPASTVFNPTTALPNYSGDNAVTVQPGDTVSSIAKRYDMTAQEFEGFLKQQYGENADLNSIVAGHKLPLPQDVYERTSGGVNGLDLTPETPTPTSGAKEVNDALVDAFSNPQAPTDKGVQVADANGGLPDTSTPANPNTFTHFLDAQGSTLSPAQQNALATQLDKLNLGGEGDLSFYSLPNGGALIANADGDIVGEIVHSNSGNLNLRATGIDTDGNTVEVNNHIGEGGDVQTQDQYTKAQTQQVLGDINQGLDLFNALSNIQNWSQLSDVGKLSAVVGLYNAIDGLGAAFSGTGNNLPGDLGAAAGWLSLAQGLQSGDGFVIAAGLNSVSDQALDGALNSAFGSTGVPYVSIALALHNFEDNPAQSIGTLVGMYFGGPLGGAIGGFIGGFLGGMFGDDDIPMQEGLAHAQWDDSGHTQVVTTQNAEGGGATANSWMNGLVGGLQTQLNTYNSQHGLSNGMGLDLVPNLLPSVGFKYDPDGFNLANGARGFMYLQWTDEAGQTQTRYYDGAGNRGDGSGETLAGDFMAHAQGAIAPAWQVQTTLAHWQQSGVIDLPKQSSSLPTELVDGLHQTLQVVSLTLPNTLPVETTSSSKWIDVDGDGYLEQTQWLQTNQAVLAVDLNGDGQISVGETVNMQKADQARTSMAWLDANGDGKLTAQDPAFAALKLWVDVNADGKSTATELQSLTQAHITSIDFSTNPPSIERADGSQQALTMQTLTADTLGVAFERTAGGMVETTEQLDGTGSSVLHAVNTRAFDGQAAHTQGGGQDVDGSNGDVMQVDASKLATTTHHTIANNSTQTSTMVGAGDARLKSLAAIPTANTSTTASTTASSTNNATSTRIAFVPMGQTSAQQEIQRVTDSMIESSQSLLFGASANAGLGVLAAVGMGAVQSAQAVEQRAIWLNQIPSSSHTPALNITPNSTNNTFNTAPSGISTDTSSSFVSFKQVDLGSLNVPQLVQVTTPTLSSQSSVTPITVSTSTELPSTAFMYATVVSTPVLVAPSKASATVSSDVAAPVSAWQASVNSAQAPSLGYPQVQAETLPGTEDVVLRLTQSVLLANESTPNASADSSQPALTITAVSAPLHGQVSLVNGEVLFAPDINFHGTARFTYTVTDQYGLSTNGTATLLIAAVNDAPVTLGESVASDEDIGLIFTQAQLLANDSDVDMATDGQVLHISRVGQAEHGTVWIDDQGNLRFVPEANYHGPAQFTYWVSDGLATNGAGAEVPATVSLTILAVNDSPVVTGETLNNRQEDVPLLFNPATLLANDTDVDVATDGQVLRITAIGSAQHGTVAWATQPDGSQYIAFTPERNYFGMASYQYTVSDGNGGAATTTVVVNLAAVNDAPDVVNDTLSATEDTPLAWTQADLLANDSDVDNPHTALRIVGVSNATHGSVSLNGDGSISFNPELDYFGVATFNYTVGDGAGGFSVGTATVNIAPVNDAPVAEGERLTLKEDEVATLSVASLLANDHDVDNPNAQLRIQSVGNASHGIVSLVTTNGITSVVFTPELNYNGAASFTYTVSDGVGGTATASVSLDFTPVNDAPVVNNELYMGKRNVSYSLSEAALLANDTDLETPNGLSLVSVGNAQHGSVNLLNGIVVFVPEAGYSGKGRFDYVVRDADGGQSTATTQIDFSRVNVNPTAVDDSFSGFEDVPFSITQAQLLANDSDSDNANTSLRVTNLGSASHGQVAFDAHGNVVFTPDANFNGQASFSYQVSDGDGGSTWATASVSVASVNDAPIIEDIWYGRPIYGYKWQASVSSDEYGSYAGHTWRLVAVTSESEARALLSNPNDFVSADAPARAPDRSRRNDLMTSTGALLSENLYHNGQQKPIAFDSLDAGETDEYGTVSHSNDPYRQNGGIVAYDPDGDSTKLTFSIGSTPQHGHAWVNQYASLDAPALIDHTQAGTYWVNQTASWQYFSTRGDTYSGADGFKVSVTDSAGDSTSITVHATHKGSSPAGGGGKKPVTLDLNGDGLQYIGLDDSKAYFDVNDDGWRERMAWVGAGDGLLALDTQGDHSIDKWNEISFVGYKAGAQTDLEGLQAFDSSGNGQLDRLDARWHEFGAWIDANANGTCETGEFKTLDDLGIVSINLSSDHQMSTPAIGVTEFGKSSFTTVDGKTHAVGDVAFAVDNTQTLPQMTTEYLQLAEVVRQAILFNQVVNTVSASNAPPLSFVSNELLTQDWVQPELHTLVDAHATSGVRTP